MGDLERITARSGRVSPGASIDPEGGLVARLARRDAPPPRSAPVAGERVAIPELAVRHLSPRVVPGRPAPLLLRLSRRKLVLEPVGPGRGAGSPR